MNAVIYGSILKGFSRKKHMDRVWAAFEEMKAHGFLAKALNSNFMTFQDQVEVCWDFFQIDIYIYKYVSIC